MAFCIFRTSTLLPLVLGTVVALNLAGAEETCAVKQAGACASEVELVQQSLRLSVNGSRAPRRHSHENDASLADIRESVEHCFEKRGLTSMLKPATTKAYMHSGTAVMRLGCRDDLNDVDLWVPLLKVNMVSRNVLIDAYKGKKVKWLAGAGKTDKGKDEYDDQVYCPKEFANGKWYLEVDAFVGIGALFDKDPFGSIASDGIAAAELEAGQSAVAAYNWKLFTIGTCKLLDLKYALMNGGRGKDDDGNNVLKPTDKTDFKCICDDKGYKSKVGYACATCRKPLPG